MQYYRDLRELIKSCPDKSEALAYIDETGFEETEVCEYGWSERGKKLYGEKSGKRKARENLVAARRKGKKDLIAPMLFQGSLNAEGFEGWLEHFLLPDLTIKPSILLMDNAPIHRKTQIKRRVEKSGHKVLFLPKYSPDLNDIEHDFSAIKRKRMYADKGTPIDVIIREYCST